MLYSLPDNLHDIDQYIKRARLKTGQAMRLRNSWDSWYDELSFFDAVANPQKLKDGQDRLIAFDAANGGSSIGADMPMPKLKLGSTDSSTGGAVSKLQRGIGAPITGTFDQATLSKVKAWQTSKGLTGDGIVGPATWGTISLASSPSDKVKGALARVKSGFSSGVAIIGGGVVIGVGAAALLTRK